MKSRILVVEQDDAIRAALHKVLTGENFDVLVAANAEEALPIFTRTSVGLLLLDLNLPTKNGWDLFELFAEINPMVPIIIITGRMDGPPSVNGNGVDAVLEKPIDVDLLLDSIAALLAEPSEARLHRLIGRNDLFGHGGVVVRNRVRSASALRKRSPVNAR